MTDGTTSSTATPRHEEPMPIDRAAELVEDVVENVERVIVGKHAAVEHVLVAILARGHLLLEDVPGVGKTMLARSISRSIDCEFTRIQFTPDLLPSDVTGVNVYNQQTEAFEFDPGPIFGNVVLGDEINRGPPKTQSALLEAMEEEQVTVDGETHPMPQPFTVIATQNAIDRDRTYELPLAQLDRFTKRLGLGHPDAEDEAEMLRRVAGHHPIESLDPVASAAEVRRARETVASVTVEEAVREYVTRLVDYTRRRAALGASPRGSIHLVRTAQARAVMDGREYVIPDDIQTEAITVLSHRIRQEADAAIGGEEARSLVREALQTVAVE